MASAVLAGMGELGTFRLPSGQPIRCRVDPSGRLSAYREVGPRLVPCDARVLLSAAKLSDDPDWLLEHEPAGISPRSDD